MLKVDLGSMDLRPEKGPAKEIFYDSSSLKAQVMRLEAGQSIPPCKMENDVLFYIIEGKGEIAVDQVTEKLEPGVSVVVPRQAESRSISATSAMQILAVQGKKG